MNMQTKNFYGFATVGSHFVRCHDRAGLRVAVPAAVLATVRAKMGDALN